MPKFLHREEDALSSYPIHPHWKSLTQRPYNKGLMIPHHMLPPGPSSTLWHTRPDPSWWMPPSEAVDSSRAATADCRLYLTYQTENLAWQGTQRKKKKGTSISGLIQGVEDSQVEEAGAGQLYGGDDSVLRLLQTDVGAHQRHLLDGGAAAVDADLGQHVGVSHRHLPVPAVDPWGVWQLVDQGTHREEFTSQSCSPLLFIWGIASETVYP